MLFLGGGGDEHDSYTLDAAFAAQITGGRLLYLPVAMDRTDGNYNDCETWIHSVFEPHGITEITMWSDLSGVEHDSLDLYDAIYIGGGNTYRLLHVVRTQHFDVMLQEFARTDRPIYGGSAGAVLLGLDISTCAHMDENSLGIRDTTGLGMVGAYSVWCHYQPSDDTHIQAFGRPVIAIPERSGVLCDAGKMHVVGTDFVVRFDEAGIKRFAPGEPFD